jgi:hypothetical protein
MDSCALIGKSLLLPSETVGLATLRPDRYLRRKLFKLNDSAPLYGAGTSAPPILLAEFRERTLVIIASDKKIPRLSQPGNFTKQLCNLI